MLSQLDLTNALFSQDFVKRFHRAVWKADVGAVFVNARTFDQPWLSGPAGGDARGRRKHGRDVMNTWAFFRRNSLGRESGIERGTLPVFVPDIVGLQDLQPKILPKIFLIGGGPLRPDILMVLEICVKTNSDPPHVGYAGGFLGALVKLSGVRNE